MQKDDKIDSSVLGISKKYWNDNLKDIIKYCFQDCLITAGLADLFYTDLWEKNIIQSQKTIFGRVGFSRIFLLTTHIFRL